MRNTLYNAVGNTTSAALDIIRLLRQCGSDPTVETANGSSPLRYVRRFGKPQEMELFADLLDTDDSSSRWLAPPSASPVDEAFTSTSY
jgi:hypothetical protein